MRLTIQKLVYGGNGLARTDQGVVFVPRTAPDDVIEAEIIEQKKDYGVARLVTILESSPHRQTPSCPNYETAGCCHWQHIIYERQLEFKEEIIRESLSRLGRISWTDSIQRIAGPDRNYRLRATFHVSPQGELGFMRERTNVVVPIRECSALAPELNAFLRNSQGPFKTTQISVVSTPSIEVNGLQYKVDADVFFQANRFLLEPFAGEVIRQAGSSPKHVLDLYCGSGFFSLPLARTSVEVIGVEAEPHAVRQARENARSNKITNVRFVEGSVDRLLNGSQSKPDVIVLNPPRSGAGIRNVAQVANLRPDRIVYISCNPTTFAREAAALAKAGYMLDQLTMVDQFPNTYHIETVASFTRH